MHDGVFITFEGSEGAGKSTQIAHLRERLSARLGPGRAVRILREPGGTAVGEEIRRLLKHDPAGWALVPEAELLLFAASRAQLVRQLIAPALAAGEWVICDRFLDSTTVYQGVARHLEPAVVDAINGFAAGERRPDVTFLLDLPPALAMARARQRETANAGPDRMEEQPEEFFAAVHMGYLRLAELHPARFVVLDATRPVPELADRIWTLVTERFHGLRPLGCL